MMKLKFVFLGKVFTISFILINVVNIIPFNIFNVSYYINFSTVLLDTTTLLLIGILIPRYIFFNELRFLENSIDNNPSDTLKNKKISSLQIKNFQGKKISFLISIFFLVITLTTPVLLLLDMNKNDIYLTNSLLSFENDLSNKKNQIEELMIIAKKNQVDQKDFNKLKKNLENLSKLKDDQTSMFVRKFNLDRFNTTKILIRNFFLGLLWTFAFYKISQI